MENGDRLEGCRGASTRGANVVANEADVVVAVANGHRQASEDARGSGDEKDGRIHVGIRSRLSVRTLLVCIGLGLAGILPDIDHLFEGMARTSHLPLAVLGGCLFGIALALDYRRVHASGVRRRQRVPEHAEADRR